MTKRQGKNKEADRTLKELRQIKNLLILSLLKAGATSEEVNFATGMGAANIRGMFPVKRGRKKATSFSDKITRTSANAE
jgi:hypothetical protein